MTSTPDKAIAGELEFGSCDSQLDEQHFRIFGKPPVAPPAGGLQEVIDQTCRAFAEHMELIDRSHDALWSALGYIYVQSAWISHVAYRAVHKALAAEIVRLADNVASLPDNLRELTARELLLLLRYSSWERDKSVRSKCRTLFKAADKAEVGYNVAGFVAWVKDEGGIDKIVAAYREAHKPERNKNRETCEPATAWERVQDLLPEISATPEEVTTEISPDEANEELIVLLLHPKRPAPDGKCTCERVWKSSDPKLIDEAVETIAREIEDAAAHAEFERKQVWKLNKFMLKLKQVLPGKMAPKDYAYFKEAAQKLYEDERSRSRFFVGKPEFGTLEIDDEHKLYRPHTVNQAAGVLDPARYVRNAKIGELVPYDYDGAISLKHQRSINEYIQANTRRRNSTSETANFDIGEPEASDA